MGGYWPGPSNLKLLLPGYTYILIPREFPKTRSDVIAGVSQRYYARLYNLPPAVDRGHSDASRANLKDFL